MNRDSTGIIILIGIDKDLMVFNGDITIYNQKIIDNIGYVTEKTYF